MGSNIDTCNIDTDNNINRWAVTLTHVTLIQTITSTDEQ